MTDRSQSRPPSSADPQILANWLERRCGGRKETAILVFKLAAYYATKAEEEERRHVKHVA